MLPRTRRSPAAGARARPSPPPALLLAAAALLAACAVIPASAAAPTVHLSDGPWTLTSQNGSVSYSDVQLPVYPHQVLQHKGAIGDPLYRYNELETRWISDETWTYERSFDVSAEQAAFANADLLLKGLDTFATVALNGEPVLRADNFHRTWRVPVQGLLKAGKNTLAITVEPALATTLRLKKDLPYTVTTLQQPGSLDVFNYVRKGAYSFGWDWGAAFPINGVHGEVDLVFFEHPHLVGAHIVSQQLVTPVEEGDKKGKKNAKTMTTTAATDTDAPTTAPYFKVEVEAQFETASQAAYSGDLFVDLDLGNGKHITATKTVDVPRTPKREAADFLGAVHADGQGERRDKALAASQFFATVDLAVPRSEVELWWPVGLGGQPLYNLTVSFRPADGSADCGAALAAGKAAEGDADAKALLATPFFQRGPPSGPLPPAHGDPAMRIAARRAAPYGVGEACSAVQRRMGFRTIEVVTLPGPKAAQGDLKASWDWLPAKGAPAAVQKEKLSAEARQLAATAAAAGAKPDWTLYEGKWVFLDTPQVKDPNLIEGYNFSTPPSNALKPMVPAGNGKMRQAVVTDGDSESFYFRVNGVPVYSKGSNLIPFTLFPTTDSYDMVYRTLAAARDAHHNTVRIWGGGIYQSEAFHDVADAMGLLVWEEAMFACGSYPSALPGFLSNVQMEIKEQVRRVAGRAAVAIWGGNNEVEMSLDWFPNTRDNRMLYAVEYHELFIKTIGGAMRQLAPYLHYLDSSASNGYAWHPTPEQGRSSSVLPVKRWGKPGDWRYGDTHFYNYGFDCESARDFPRAKFVSEFGFLSVPNFETWAEATDPAKGDWAFGDFSPVKYGVNNTMTNYRSRRYSHINEILNQAKRHFRVPGAWRVEAPANATADEKAAAAAETERLYKQFFWLTNQQQAACYRVGTAAWRRQRSEANALTMGVLYWQLNDVWAGWSWSGYDWAGRWKPMHYALKKEFAPLVSQAFYDRVSDRVEVFAVSDEPVSAKDAKLTVTVRRLLAGVEGGAGDEASSCAARPSAVAKVFEVSGVEIPAAGAARVWDMAADDILSQAPGCTRRSCYITAQITASYPEMGKAANEADAAGAPRPRSLSSTGEAFFGYWKEVDAMPRAEIVASDFKQGSDDRTVVFRVSEKKGASAALVTLDTPFPGSFDDNGFVLHAASGGSSDGSGSKSCVSASGREVTFRSDAPMAPQDLRDALTITSLFDYQPVDANTGKAAAPTPVAVGVMAGARAAAPAAEKADWEYEWGQTQL